MDRSARMPFAERRRLRFAGEIMVDRPGSVRAMPQGAAIRRIRGPEITHCPPPEERRTNDNGGSTREQRS